jgi:hypothetical protein
VTITKLGWRVIPQKSLFVVVSASPVLHNLQVKASSVYSARCKHQLDFWMTHLFRQGIENKYVYEGKVESSRSTIHIHNVLPALISVLLLLPALTDLTLSF